MGDSTYQDMLSDKKTENKKDAKREVLSKFGKTTSSGSVEYFTQMLQNLKIFFVGISMRHTENTKTG